MLAVSRAALALGAFVVVGALWCLFFVRPGTGEFVIAVSTVGIGAVVLIIAVVLARRELRRVVQSNRYQEDQ